MVHRQMISNFLFVRGKVAEKYLRDKHSSGKQTKLLLYHYKLRRLVRVSGSNLYVQN